MKLVELLAREWSEWPSNCDYAVCDSDGEIRAIGTGTHNDFYPATAVDLEDRLNGTALLVSDDGKRVTRSSWAAERARIAKPAKKADKYGWIRHRGGKCPVEAGVKVDYRMRYGEIDCFGHDAGILQWSHEPGDGDIMAYRLHKPVDQVEACSKPDPCDSAKRDSDYVCWMRDRITEIDATTQALTTERADLVQKLASEGFALIGRAVEPVEDMSDWRNWKVGDIVECVSHNERWSAKFAIGSVNVIKEIITDSDVPVDLTINIGYYVSPFDFKWHSRPSA